MFRGIAISVVALALAGCGGGTDYTGTYVAGDETAVMQLSLVEADNGQINATLSMSSLNYEDGKIDTVSGGMTGIRDGSNIGLLAANGAGGSMTLKGDGNNIEWQVPETGQTLVFVEANEAEYQAKLVKLNEQLYANDVGMLPYDHEPHD